MRPGLKTSITGALLLFWDAVIKITQVSPFLDCWYGSFALGGFFGAADSPLRLDSKLKPRDELEVDLAPASK